MFATVEYVKEKMANPDVTKKDLADAVSYTIGVLGRLSFGRQCKQVTRAGTLKYSSSGNGGGGGKVWQQNRHSRGCFWRIGRFFGAYVTSVYIFVKGAYVGNIVLQLYMLKWFLGMDTICWGYDVSKFS